MKSVILMSQFGNGRKRNCDKQCYNAMNSKCHCVCNGMNHSKGLKQASENTNKFVQKQLAQLGKKIEVRDGTVYLLDTKKTETTIITRRIKSCRLQRKGGEKNDK